MKTDSFRLAKFKQSETDLWYSKIYKRLKKHEIEYCIEFIQRHDHLDKSPFEAMANRLFLDQPEVRANYKNWTCMQELIARSNVGFVQPINSKE